MARASVAVCSWVGGQRLVLGRRHPPASDRGRPRGQVGVDAILIVARGQTLARCPCLLRGVLVAANAALPGTAAVERAISAGALSQALLLLLQAVQEVDDDVSYAGEEVVEARLRRFLAQRLLENASQQLGHVAQVVGVDADGIEGARGDVELIPKAHVDVGDLALGGGPARP